MIKTTDNMCSNAITEPALFQGPTDAQSFEILYAEHHANVRRFLMFRGATRFELDDLTQEVFARAWQFRSRFQARARISTFLFAIASNVLREHRRLRKNEEARLKRMSAMSFGSAPEPNEELAVVERAKEKLSQRHREILHSAYVLGHTHRQIAIILQCSCSAVRSRLSEARKRLRVLACSELRNEKVKKIATILIFLGMMFTAQIAGAEAQYSDTANKTDSVTDTSGIDCLQRAMRLLGKPTDTLTLLTSLRSPRGQDIGLDDLGDIARARGLRVKRFAGTSLQLLANLNGPLILHVKGARYSTSPDCFVVCAGTANGMAHILIAESELQVPVDLLASRWNGDALALSESEIPELSVPGYMHPYARYGLLVCVAVVVGGASLLSRKSLSSMIRTSGRRRFQATIAEACVLVVTAILLGFSIRAIASEPLLPVRPVLATPDSDTVNFFSPAATTSPTLAMVPRVNLAEATRLFDQQVIFVDARDQDDFRAGHIKGAVLCPASDLAHLRLYMAGIARERQVVVYCVSSSCSRAHWVADALTRVGYREVIIYSDGWSKWTGPKEKSLD